jgi:hypothetical protein
MYKFVCAVAIVFVSILASLDPEPASEREYTDCKANLTVFDVISNTTTRYENCIWKRADMIAKQNVTIDGIVQTVDVPVKRIINKHYFLKDRKSETTYPCPECTFVDSYQVKSWDGVNPPTNKNCFMSAFCKGRCRSLVTFWLCATMGTLITMVIRRR